MRKRTTNKKTLTFHNRLQPLLSFRHGVLWSLDFGKEDVEHEVTKGRKGDVRVEKGITSSTSRSELQTICLKDNVVVPEPRLVASPSPSSLPGARDACRFPVSRLILSHRTDPLLLSLGGCMNPPPRVSRRLWSWAGREGREKEKQG